MDSQLQQYIQQIQQLESQIQTIVQNQIAPLQSQKQTVIQNAITYIKANYPDLKTLLYNL